MSEVRKNPTKNTIENDLDIMIDSLKKILKEIKQTQKEEELKLEELNKVRLKRTKLLNLINILIGRAKERNKHGE